MKVLVDAIMNYGGWQAFVGVWIGAFIGDAANQAAHCLLHCTDLYQAMLIGGVLGFLISRTEWAIKKIRRPG